MSPRVVGPVPARVFGLSTGRLVILAGVVGVLALTLAMPLRTYFSQSSESARLAVQQRQLQQQVAQLQQQRAQQQDPAYVRAQARSRLRLVEPGETPYIVQLPGEYEASIPTVEQAAPSPGPWYSRLWQGIAAGPTPTVVAPPETVPPMPTVMPAPPRQGMPR
jgi:cell division protein FtsB